MIHWLVQHGLLTALVSWSVAFTLGATIVPLVRRVWRGSKRDLERIADLLDSETPGGLHDVKTPIDELLHLVETSLGHREDTTEDVKSGQQSRQTSSRLDDRHREHPRPTTARVGDPQERGTRAEGRR